MYEWVGGGVDMCISGRAGSLSGTCLAASLQRLLLCAASQTLQMLLIPSLPLGRSTAHLNGVRHVEPRALQVLERQRPLLLGLRLGHLLPGLSGPAGQEAGL